MQPLFNGAKNRIDYSLCMRDQKYWCGAEIAATIVEEALAARAN